MFPAHDGSGACPGKNRSRSHGSFSLGGSTAADVPTPHLAILIVGVVAKIDFPKVNPSIENVHGRIAEGVFASDEGDASSKDAASLLENVHGHFLNAFQPSAEGFSRYE
jgi:hypothetical protein